MDTLRIMPRPKTGVTPVRNVRVAAELWEKALEKARQTGETITAVIVRALEAYVAEEPKDGEQ